MDRSFAAWLVVVMALASPVRAAPSPLAPWGEARFPPLYREAIRTWVDAADAYRRADYTRAVDLLDAFWNRHPAGTREWKAFQRETAPLHVRADFGTPPAYAALRMLTECARWRVKSGKGPAKETVQLTVLLVGASEARQPASPLELRRGGGAAEVHRLDTTFRTDAAARVLDEASWLFDEYVVAMTRGELGVRRVLVPLPEFQASIELAPGRVKLSRPETERIFAAVPASIARATDWWHIVYPSQVPTAPAFTGTRFITGGLRAGPRGSSAPCLVSEDLKLLRAPNQDGRHVLTPLEREVALAQWLQHEFFHHLFALYRDERLEAASHQWQDRKRWPDDFEGLVEADYYAEALHKRLWTHPGPSLADRLRHAGRAEDGKEDRIEADE